MSLNDLHLKYRDRVQFLNVYIREAHPRDGWWLGGGVAGQYLKATGSKAATDVYDPRTIEERRSVADRCCVDLAYHVPTVVDEIDDPVNKAYAAMPTRLYLVGLDGKVVYAGGLGPWGFHPDELGAAIQEYLSQIDSGS